mmetsp:Transcript_3721/g.5089  ORF Transcript_3721/g.5089 Transcript_3721/m.5089 type:complete len:266 (+) Transcript_3721:219-1016(+)
MYDGTAFRGWQEQDPKLRTTQGVISGKLSERYSKQRVRVTGAGRTDQGVHARGQTIHFDVPNIIDDIEHFQYTFNRMLPSDIRIYNLTTAPPGNEHQQRIGEPFHAIKSATGKLYIYKFTTNPFVEPNLRNYCSHIYRPIDIHLLQECLSKFVGTHDFRAFGNRVEQSLKDYDEKHIDYSTIRTIRSIDLIHEGNGYYRVEFQIKSAIYKMIRNIMGTSFMVAAGDMPASLLCELLEKAPPRIHNEALPAQPQGLTLEHVHYDHY